MKTPFKVWEKEDSAKRVYLRLVDTCYEGVFLQVVDRDGYLLPGGKLLRITPDGYLQFSIVSGDLGFQLDKSGRIKIKKK